LSIAKQNKRRFITYLFLFDLNLKKTLFVSAMNVHAGGGRSLLHSMLKSLPPELRVVALLDARMPVPDCTHPNFEIRAIRPTIRGRMLGEAWLARQVKVDDIVLCFGNLPPLFSLRCKAAVFVQNRYLIDWVAIAGFGFKTRLRLMAERYWLWSRQAGVKVFFVQTPSMQMLMEAFVDNAGKVVHLLPFSENAEGYSRSLTSHSVGDVVDFIYVASGEPHKNHRKLIEAWCDLAKDGFFPSLWLTLDRQSHPDLCNWVEECVARWGLRVENLGLQPHAKIKELFGQVKALIYPSTFESFGLPLIEARQAGLAVIASELDYVRDVLDPEQVFDPRSSISIARAVKRYMGWAENSLPLANAKIFLREVIEKCEQP
jgi:glycosyltransferase involved in cell wall biosynthesis